VEPRSARAPDAELSNFKPGNFKRGKFKRNHFIETAGLEPAF
jgi:hypothetical protein